MSAQLISIEGLDGVGKGTQCKLIEQYCNTLSLKYKYFHFPMYGHNQFSNIISMFLRGEFGNNDEVDPYFIANAFAMDRWKFLPELQKHIEKNDIIILDRYVLSNIAYQSCKVPESEQSQIRDWITLLEFSFLKLPYPDLTLFLDIPVELSKNRLESRFKNETRDYLQGKQDIHEADIELQNKVRTNYLNFTEFSNYNIIPCFLEFQTDTYLLTPKEIFNLYKPLIDKLINN